jgi:hypothetical protein
MYDDECGAVVKVIGKKNQNIQRKPPVPLCQQVSHDMNWAETQAATVESWGLTA